MSNSPESKPRGLRANFLLGSGFLARSACRCVSNIKPEVLRPMASKLGGDSLPDLNHTQLLWAHWVLVGRPPCRRQQPAHINSCQEQVRLLLLTLPTNRPSEQLAAP